MAKAPKAFDVWFVAANTVYRAVPYGVVADWAQEGRLATTDMVRSAGASEPWARVSEHDLLADYVPKLGKRVAVKPPAEVVPGAGAATATPAAAATAEPNAPVELPEPEEMTYRRPHGDEDDDVDMIPLIDVSMVLLVFFILMRAAGAMAPVEVPEMKYAGQLSNDPDAITINIDKKDELTIFYSVRQGQSPAKPEDDNLDNPDKAIKALDGLLAGATKPPDVRIACHKTLPRERVYELTRDLSDRQKKGQINSFTATVTEAPEKK